MSPDFDIFSVF